MKLTSLKKLFLKSVLATAVVSLMMVTAHAGPSFQTKNGAEAEVYGFVRADAVYKIHGNDGSVWNTVESAPINGGRDLDLNTTMSTTRLGVNFNAPVEGQRAGGKIEGDFLGNGTGSRAFRVRHAYATYNNWLLGQTWSTFNDMNTFADIIDFNPIAGQGASRPQMVRYEAALNPTLKVAGALEKNAHYDQVPNLVGRVQFSPNSQAYLSGRGFVTQAHLDGIDKKEISYGVGVSGSYKVTDTVKLLGEYNHVKGNSQYLEKANTFALINPNKELVLNEYDTFLVGGEVKVTPSITANAGVGYLKSKSGEYANVNIANATDSKTGKVDNEAVGNKSVKQGFVNVQYKPVTPVTVGVEYVHGERETFNNQKGKDNRVGFMASYAF